MNSGEIEEGKMVLRAKIDNGKPQHATSATLLLLVW